MAVDDSFTKVLLHMDGANASNTFTDESGTAWTALGDAKISTASSVYGQSGKFDGAGDYIRSAGTIDTNFGTTNFTIDCWFYRSGGAGAPQELSSRTNSAAISPSDSSWEFGYLNTGNKVQHGWCIGGTEAFATSTTTTGTGVWYHTAMVRSGTWGYLFINGTLQGSAVVSGSINAVGTSLCIGRLGDYNGRYFNGYIDEFRISCGTARWTADFTVPISPYGQSDSGYTLILNT